MTPTPAPPARAQSPSRTKVWRSLTALGEATTAQIAEHAGIGYSTTTPQLRSLAAEGLAERREDNGRTVWRLTDAGRNQPPPGTGTPAPQAANEVEGDDPQPDGTGEPAASPPAGQPHSSPAPADAQPTREMPTARQPSPPDGASPDKDGNTPEPSEPDGSDPSDTSDDDGRTVVGVDAGPGYDEAAEPPAVTGDQTRPDGTPPPGPGPAVTAAESRTGPAEPPGGPADAATPTPKPARRTKGALDGEVFDVLSAQPESRLTVTEVARLIDAAAARAGLAVSKASPGAVVLTLGRLVDAGRAVQTREKPATYQLAPDAE